MLSLGLLGSFVCHWRGELVELRARKAQALLVYLAMNFSPHQRSALAYLLWPDAIESRARASLSRALSSLREAMGGDAFVTSRDAIALSPTLSIECDVHQLEAAATAIECPHHTGTPVASCAACQGPLKAAIAQVRGPLLQGFRLRQAAPFHEWLAAEQSNVDDLLLQTMSWLMDGHEAAGALPEAIAVGQQLLLLQPHHEPSVRKLLQWCAALGQQPKVEQLYQRLLQSLGRTWGLEPEPETTALYETLHKKTTQKRASVSDTPDKDERPQAAWANNAGTPFLGRVEELAALQEQLSGEGEQRRRLLSLVGPGGIGKTRLAQQLAQGLTTTKTFSEGVWFVPLESVLDAAQVWPALAERLNYLPSPGQPLERQLFGYLRHKSMLLVLDNTEQIEGFEGLVRACVQHTTAPTFLVTSRKRLALPEEWVFVVEGLTYPAQEEVGDMARHSAIAFFIQCGRRSHTRFEPGPQEYEDIAWICRWLGGIPLCLELAASWLRALTPRQIREALTQDDALLTSSFQDIPARQHSTRLVFATTWSMLTPEEQSGFARLSVFRGGLTYQAARAIAHATPQMLRTWLERFLIQRQPDGRFTLHALLRQYATEKCDDTSLPARHARYYLSWLAKQETQLARSTQITTLRSIEGEWNNLIAGWRWALDAVEETLLARASAPLAECFRLRGWFQEGFTLFAHAANTCQTCHTTPAQWLHLHAAAFALSLHQRDDALLHLERAATLAKGAERAEAEAYYLHLQGRLAQQRSEHDEAQRYQQASLTLGRELESPGAMLQSLHALGDLACRRGAHEEGRVYFREGLAIARELGGPEALAEALNQLGTLAGMTGDYALAKTHFEESHEHYKQVGSLFGRARTLNNRAILLYIQGELEASYEMRQRCLALCRDLGSPVELVRALSHLGSTAREMGRYEEAKACAKESLALGQEHGDTRGTIQALAALASTYIHEQRWTDAHHHVAQAMHQARLLGLAPVALHLLVLCAELQLAQGHYTQGATLLAYLHNHPLCDKQTQHFRQKLLDKHFPPSSNPENTAQTQHKERPPWQQMLNDMIAAAERASATP